MNFRDLIEGAADIHVHSAPDIDPRRYDDIDLAREAARAGMSALVLKSHQNSTVERAIIASKVVAGIQVFGGLALNESVGGLNPAAVKVALQLGAKQIWMPTRSAANHRRFTQAGPGGISILDEHGIGPAIDEILELIAPTDCVLGTGHLSPEESLKLVDRAVARGVKKIVITHPEWNGTYFSVEQQQRLARWPQVRFERCFVSTTHRCGFTPMETIAEAITQVGPESTILSSDLGQPDTPAPAEGLRIYAEKLIALGIGVDEVRRMMVDQPRQLLGLQCGAPVHAAR